jgi:hypothetical protein
MIRHLKEGNYLRNAWQEHICHLVNDEFLEMLAESARDIEPASYLEMMGALREELGRRTERCSPLLRGYFTHLNDALGAWVQALDGLPAGEIFSHSSGSSNGVTTRPVARFQ